MTEVPDTILWIAASALIAQTVFVIVLVVVLIVVLVRVKGLVTKANEAADAIKGVANSIADTVSDVGASATKPLAALKIFSTFRKAGKRRGRK